MMIPLLLDYMRGVRPGTRAFRGVGGFIQGSLPRAARADLAQKWYHWTARVEGYPVTPTGAELEACVGRYNNEDQSRLDPWLQVEAAETAATDSHPGANCAGAQMN